MSNPSVWLHSLLWPRSPRMSLCARAWEHRLYSHRAWWWVVIFGRKHCDAAWRWHVDHAEPWNEKW